MESGPSADGVLVVARRYSAQGVEELREGVPLEEPLAVEIEGEVAAVLMRTPGAEKALALGYCLSEGLIRSLGDVLLLHHCGSGAEEGMVLPGAEAEGALGGRNRVRLRLTPAAAAALPERRTRWVFSGCAGVDAATMGAQLAVGRAELRLPADVLQNLVPALAARQDAYRATGGVHAAALAAADGSIVAVGEDVGRHNAVDKAIGAATLMGRLPEAAVLVATGRASSDIVAKAARVGVPVVASFSSTASLALRLSEAAGVTLIGYLRRNRFTIYTHPERIAS